jgi:HAD superfamily hydrolase (TIGR01549 family)
MFERNERISAVLFDLDGTLINTKRLYLEAYRRALQPDLGRLLTDAEMLAIGSRTERRVFESFLPAGNGAECMQRFYQHYAELHASHFEGLYPGVAELLQTLRLRGVPLGIVTGKSRRAWEVTAAATELGPFDVVVVEDDVTQPKPDPSGLHAALIALGRGPTEALYVGDGAHDLQAARAAGILGVAALWSKRGERRTQLERAARDVGAALASSPQDVLALL